MRTPTALAAALALILLTSGAALAQEHEHATGKARVVVTQDLTPEGYALVGNTAHFGFVLLGDDGTPVRHHDATATLEQNGVILFTSDALHDYDGVGAFAYTFTVPGPFTFTVSDPSDPTLTASFTGTAVLREHEPATLALTASATAPARAPVRFEYAIVDGNGTLRPHTDVILEARRVLDDELVFRIHTHTHEEPQVVDLAFPDPGAYTVRLTGYNAFPTEDAPAFAAFTTTHAIDITPGLPAPTVQATAPASAEAKHAGEGHYKLFATYDPQELVGPMNAMRANVVVYDEEVNATVQHVNFEATLRDPAGNVLFQSATLHEYDGVLEVLGTYRAPGDYVMDVTAQHRNWSDTITLTWRVLPPAFPVGAGYFEILLNGADALQAGVPAALDFLLATPGGAPFMHSEVDFQVMRITEGPALAQTKLHTHDDGRFPFTFTFPEAGEYVIRVDPTPTSQSASPTYLPGAPGAPRYVHVTVGEGPGLPLALPPAEQATEAPIGEVSVPEASAPAALLALAALALLARRLRR